ncbi:PadR family transcriptional regulator [Epidermidibacterium keratini]|uniref:PadR family transcriptional regulator n=1 Tax=Epidermidibacterium keratini TaxID=1891644 RepID=A0A7L4YQN7_9ACTN|nr:PadR family transcriptional regulator [Epidermidibacterium keratini]QHC01214.1 PadR family transcriptional regulator [Epidermidibacterium keratini]
MSLRFAILTALTEKSSSGIELARRFDRSIGYFWPASHQQIYRELDKLHADGLVSPVGDAPSTTRGNPKVMQVTDAGTEALREWANATEPTRKPRDPLMVRVRAAAVLDDVDLRDSLRQQLTDHESRLAEYVEIEQSFSGELDRRARLQLQILRSGIASERMWVQWCRETLGVLDDAD